METSVLQQIQGELKCPKNQFNSFGKYNYRNAEDIQEALKPILANHGHALMITDRLVQVGESSVCRIYVEATVRVLDNAMGCIAETKAFAREPLVKKGMDEAQITGATSSYARKYALGGMFLLDDTKDADSMKPEAEKPKSTMPDYNKEEAKALEKADKPPTPFEVMIGKFMNAKPKMREKAGDDSVYKAGLKTLGVEHANEIDKAHGLSIADGNKLLKEFWVYLHPEEKKAAPKKTTTFPPEE